MTPGDGALDRGATPVPDDAWSPEAGERLAAAGQPEVAVSGYRDVVLLARGGDSIVYRAWQEAVGRLVAVKVIRVDPEPGVGMGSAARFQRELELTVRLGRAHPNIVTVLDTGLTAAGQPYIVMEYHDLGSLHDQLRAHGPLPASAVVTAGTVVADALAYAHGQGVLHRDVKPQNILVLPTSYVLADFGLARHVDTERSSSLERFSYRHAAPQVLDGELPTVADDLYSLGSTLFTLLDGRPPFAVDDPGSDSALAYLRRVRTEPPRPLRCPDASSELRAAVERCLAKRREDRFPDAASLRDALAAVVTEARQWAPAPTTAPAPATTTRPPAPVAVPAPVTAPSPPAPVPVPGPEDPPDQPGPAPVPPAWSAMAHLDPRPDAGLARVPEPSDEEATWDRPGADTAVPAGRPAAPAPATQPAPQAQPALPAQSVPLAQPAPPAQPALSGELTDHARPGGHRWRRRAVLVAVALLAGAVIGVGVTWLNPVVAPRNPSGERGEPVPTFSGQLLTPGPARVEDPRIAPRIVALDDLGTAIELRWEDRSDGEALFVVVEVTDAGARAVRQLAAGRTSVLIDGLDPTARYCFRVLAVTTASQGVSSVRCTADRPDPGD